jgi:hypothetical protein
MRGHAPTNREIGLTKKDITAYLVIIFFFFFFTAIAIDD